MRDQTVTRCPLDEHGRAGQERAHGIGTQSNRSGEDNQPVHQLIGQEGVGEAGAPFAVDRPDAVTSQSPELGRQPCSDDQAHTRRSQRGTTVNRDRFGDQQHRCFARRSHERTVVWNASCAVEHETRRRHSRRGHTPYRELRIVRDDIPTPTAIAS